MKPAKRASPPSKKHPPGSFMGRLKERKIIATLAAFIGGGWLTYEVVHWVLVDHYHLPNILKDITIVTFLGALLSTVIWQWFRGAEKRPGNVKVEVLVVPLIILLTVVIDLKFIFVMTGVSINMLLIGIVAICLGIAWVVFKSLQWAATVPEAEKKVEALKPRDEKPISFPEWKNSIAVLPFTNISGDPEQEYFCDGITEELINTLTQVKDLRVVARTSAFSFKGKDIDIREIGKTLNVNKVLEGSVRKAENRVRIIAQLVNVADGYHLWSAKYDRDMEDIFAVQDEISLAIVEALKMKLLKEEKARLVKRHTDDSEAYDYYLKGRYFWNRRTEDGLTKSVECFEKALEKDPKFALAYAGLADSISTQGFYDFILPRTDAFERAKKHALKALELDDSIGETHVAVANTKAWCDYDWEAAEQEYKKALELNPSNAEAFHMYTHLLSGLLRFDEAVVKMKMALELEPLSVNHHNCHGIILFSARRYDEAIKQLQISIELDPRFSLHHYWLGRVYIEKRMYKQAWERLNNAKDFSEIQTLALGALAYSYSVGGRKDKAQEIINKLQDLSNNKYVDPFHLAVAYIGVGEDRQAYACLNKACEELSMYIPYLTTDPIFDRLRDDSRFITLLKKMGISKL